MPLAYKDGKGTSRSLVGSEIDFANLADTVYENEGGTALWSLVHEFRVSLQESSDTPNWRRNGTRRLSRKRFSLPLPDSFSVNNRFTLYVYVTLTNRLED